jgi:sRNA-binding regulator protein Hfq
MASSEEPVLTRSRRIVVNNGKHQEPPSFSSPSKEFKAKGHDAVLKAVQDRKTACVFKTTDGESVRGQIIARDRYTISVLVEGELDARIYYKHSIAYFQPQRNAEKAAENA